MMKKLLLVMCLLMLLVVGVARAQDKVTLILGSWRTEDQAGYDKMLAMFMAENPNIEVKFSPTLNTNYNTELQTALDGGAGPDLITCRPFDLSLILYQKGYMTNIKDLPGLEHFSAVAKSAWSTDNGDAVFCVPMASVIHGFIYNKDIFAQVGVEVPTTESEFFAVLDKIKAAGITPLAMSTASSASWTTATMGFENIGVNYWDGENGRLALVNGTAKVTDKPYVDALASIAKWGAYLPDGHESLTYEDTQQLFPLGQAAIFPSGSWEITGFESLADFEMGAFKPYLPDGADPKNCWIDDHVDIAIGGNANSPHPEEVRTFLQWLTTQEFAQAFADNTPGFYPLADHPIEIKDPLAAEFLSWRSQCKSSIRIFYQFLSRGNPSASQTMFDNVYLMVQGNDTPEGVAKKIQDGLDQWFKPITTG